MRDLPPTFIAVNFPLELNAQAVGPGEESGGGGGGGGATGHSMVRAYCSLAEGRTTPLFHVETE